MTELLKNKKKLWVNIALTLCYAIFTFFIVCHHEVWTDEVQVWQMAKTLSVFELFKKLPNEGHPCLFFLLVMPLAKLHLNIFSMQMMCWLFSVAGVFILLQFSPFRWWCRLAIILSSGFLYFFPAVARSYSLLPFLVFLAAILYCKRREQPVLYGIVVALISQVLFIMFAFSALLTLLFGIEAKKDNNINKKTITAFGIMILGLLSVIFQLFGTMYDKTSSIPEVFKNPILIVNVLYNFFSNTLSDIYPVVFPLVIIAAIYFFYLLYLLYKSSKQMFFLVFLSIGFQLVLYILFYPRLVYATRIFSAFLILIFGYWVALKETIWETEQSRIKKLNIFLAIYFILTVPNGLINCKNDFKYQYSGSKVMAEYIKNNINPDSVILYQNPNAMLSLIYYLPEYDMIYSPYGERIKYVTWNDKIDKLMPTSSWEKFLTRFKNENSETIKDKDIYILQVKDFYTPIKDAEIIFISQGYKALFENYVLLKYNPSE